MFSFPNYSFIAFIVIFFLTISSIYAQKKLSTDSSNITYLRIDPSNSFGGNVSDFFSEVEYIPLETSKESLFGSISRLEVTENRYFILESTNHFVLVFDYSGKFISKVGNSSDYLTDFAVNKFTKQFSYCNDRGKNLTYCDFNGSVVRKIKLETENDHSKTSSSKMIFIGLNESVGDNFYNDEDSVSTNYKSFSKSLIHYATGDRVVYAQALSFKKSQGNLDVLGSGIGPLTLGDGDTICFYSKPYDYSIYQLTPKSVKMSYKFILPMYCSLPNDFATDTVLNGKRYEWFEKHPDMIYCISNFFRISDNVLFKTASWSMSQEDNLIYNIKSGNLIAFKHIQQDKLSQFLPIYDDFGRNFGKNGILTSRNDDIYVSLSSLEMFKSYEANLAQKTKYTPTLSAYFKFNSRKDNPVILRLKLKNNL